MYYRRKILLALLEVFDGKLEKLQLQKLLMILSSRQKGQTFHFVPYRYGCFSFQANADLSTMKKYQQVEEQEKNWIKITPEAYLPVLKPADRSLIKSLKLSFSNKNSDELIRYTYQQFPYYAINSTIAGKYLNDLELAVVEASRPQSEVQGLYTIGYEGLSLEQYLNKLIAADVKVLCDVRKNSFSMKYGFSKSQLQKACEGVGIQFIHIPEVGIVSGKRKELHTQQDYDQLFEEYRQTVLPESIPQQKQILELIRKHHRVAITCFEADLCQCHRRDLAEAICQLPDFKYQLIHL